MERAAFLHEKALFAFDRLAGGNIEKPLLSELVVVAPGAEPAPAVDRAGEIGVTIAAFHCVTVSSIAFRTSSPETWV